MFTKTIELIIGSYIIPAMGLVIALAWNSAFQKYFDENKHLHIYGSWVYAIFVTFIGLFLITILTYIQKKI